MGSKKIESDGSSHSKSALDVSGSSQRMSDYLSSGTSEPAMPFEVDKDAITFAGEIQASIDQEVAALRASGKYPPSLIARVNSYYRSLLPLGADSSVKDFKEAFWTADRVAYMDIDVPTASKKPGVSLLKRAIRMTIAWYLNYLAQQFNNFTSNLMRLLSIIDRRIEELEKTAALLNFRELELLEVTASLHTLGVFSGEISEILGTSKGRILVAECGTGKLLDIFAAKNLNAYGIDERAPLLDELAARKLDVRDEKTLLHLSNVARSSLGGLVVCGIVDRAPINERVALLYQARRTLLQGSLLVLACSSYVNFSAPANHLEFDLSVGRPFSPGTWIELMKRLKFSDIKVIESPNGDGFLVVASAPELLETTSNNRSGIDSVKDSLHDAI